VTDSLASLSKIFTLCHERDNNACQDCGSKENLEVHHVLPISQGGINELSNLKLVCHDCHLENYKDIHHPKDKSVLVTYEQREKNRCGINRNKYTPVLLTLPKSILEQIENHWHDKKLKNRNEAIRELVEIGLKAVKAPK